MNEQNKNKEIEYLEKGKRKITLITLLVLILLVIQLVTLGIGIKVFDNTKKETSTLIDDKEIVVSNLRLIVGKFRQENTATSKNGYIDGILIAMIDENAKCKSMRVVLDGYTDEELKQQYEISKGNTVTFPMNGKIINNTFHYNLNVLNGATEQEVIDFWKEHYNVEEITHI